MPIRQQTHIDRALTNISVMYMQDASNFIADKVFPTIPVMKQSDTYFIYNRDDFYRDEAGERAPGTESVGADYEVKPADPYFCRIYAFHKDVTEAERVNSDDPLTPDQDATEYTANKILIKREFIWASTYFKKGVWGRDYTGDVNSTDLSANKIQKWNLPTSTPIEDVAALSTQMLEDTGYEPNTLVIDKHTFDALKNHEEFIDRIKYTQAGFTTKELMAKAFEVDNIYVAKAVKNVKAKGEEGENKFILGKNALLCYVEKNPGIKKPSAGYIFAWKGLQGAGAFGNRVIRIPMPWLGQGTERFETEAAFDMKIVGKDLGYFIEGIVD